MASELGRLVQLEKLQVLQQQGRRLQGRLALAERGRRLNAQRGGQSREVDGQQGQIQALAKDVRGLAHGAVAPAEQNNRLVEAGQRQPSQRPQTLDQTVWQ